MKILRDTGIILLLTSAVASDTDNDATRSIAEKFRSSDDVDITANGFRLRGTGSEADKVTFFNIDAQMGRVKWMGSNDIVTARFINNDFELIGTDSRLVSNTSTNWFGISASDAVVVDLKVSGGDAILIDSAFLQSPISESGSFLAFNFDLGPGLGWCMSTDKADWHDWEGNVKAKGCFKLLRFSSRGEVYGMDSSDEWQSVQ